MVALTTALPALALLSINQLCQYIIYIYRCTWRLVTYVRRGPSHAPRPRHDVAGPSINMDLVEAEVRREASLGQAWRRGCGGGLQPDGGTARDLKGGL